MEAAECWELALAHQTGPTTLVFARQAPAHVRRVHADGIATAVVSMPSWELVEKQDAAYRASVLGERGGFVGMTGFGASGPADVLYRHFGITPEAIVAEAKRWIEEPA